MEDKDIKKVIKDMKNDENLMSEILSMEEEIFFNKDIPNIEEDIKLKILKASHEKIEEYEMTNKEKNKNIANKKNGIYKKILLSVASLVLVLVLGTPVVKAVIEKSYNYVPGQEQLFQSEGNIYVLESPITKVVNGQSITLENITMDIKNKSIYTKTEGTGLEPKEEGYINVGEYEGSTKLYSIAGGGENWSLGHKFDGDFTYTEGEKIIYTLVLSNEEKVSFEVNLKKSTGVVDYSKLGPADDKEDISIVAIFNEKDNILDVNLTSTIKGSGAQIKSYGREFVGDEYETGVQLKDVNGKIVKGKLIHHGDRANHFEFDTQDLVKPYTIEVPKVTVSIFGVMEDDGTVKLELPNKGMKDVNKIVNIKGDNYLGMEKNNTIKITTIEKIEDDSYKIDFDFQQNENNRVKIKEITLDPKVGGLLNRKDFSGWSNDIDEGEITRSIIVYVDNKNKKTLEFKVRPSDFIVEGNWKIQIN